MEFMISCVLSFSLLILMEPPLHLEIILPEPKAQDCFLRLLCGLTNGIQFVNKFKWQEIFSVVSENPISSHLVQSEVTSSTLIPNVTRRLYVRFVNSISTPAEMKKRWSLFSTHVELFFSQCAFSEMVFSSWYSSYGWHLQSPLKAASNRTWSTIFRAIQIVGTFKF